MATIGRASQAVAYLDVFTDHDVTVSAITTWECVGTTRADAFQAAADAVRQDPALEIRGLLWARIPAQAPDADEYRVTVLISSADPDFGESEESAHCAERRPCQVVLYRNASAGPAIPARVLEGLDRSGMTQAQALQATADAFRQVPDMDVEGLLWARIPVGRRPTWEYRLTVLTTSVPTALAPTDQAG
ncbi:hypothetical protein [Streptacidiphilus sp. EB103A]|uniref:hypothetical protein n=1 Tax=Streptacidiphilus sp. EB103A TaxID=3156275 RepID=UPI003511F075